MAREAERLKKDKKGESWGRTSVQGMHRQLEERESDMDIGLMEEQLGNSRGAGFLCRNGKSRGHLLCRCVGTLLG